jgi:hypothetical protein
MNSVLEKFEDIEKKLKLGDHKIQNLNWWDCFRYQTYEDLLVQLNLNGFRFFEKNNKTSKVNIFINYLIFLRKVFNCLFSTISFRSPIWIKKNSNIIFGHSRRLFENNLYIDKYSDPFIDIFENKDDFCVIEDRINESHLQPAKTKNLYFSEIFVYLSKLLTKAIFIKLTIQEKNFIQKLENEINTNFKVKIDLLNKLKNFIPKYKSELFLYKIFFKLKKPKKIIFTNSTGYESILEAAKSLKIKTYELQHGSPSRGKLNYDYSSGIKKSTFPDYFLSFGEEWTKDFILPLNKENIIEIGFPYLNKKMSSETNLLNKENIFLIISQPFISDNLVLFTLQLKNKLNKNIQFIYKPHPMELERNNMNYLKKLEQNNITVIDNYNNDLYELLKKSKWVLGVNSTVLYEAIAFKCKVFVLKVPGFEKINKLIDLNFAHLIDTADNVNNLLDKKINVKPEIFFYNDGNKTIKSLFDEK